MKVYNVLAQVNNNKITSEIAAAIYNATRRARTVYNACVAAIYTQYYTDITYYNDRASLRAFFYLLELPRQLPVTQVTLHII